MATFNVKDFGAKGNGSSNDTLAIQKAIDAAAAAGGGQVYLPEGTYMVSATTGSCLALKSNVALVGQGMGVSTLKLANDVPSAVTGILTANGTHDVGASQLTLDGNLQHNTGYLSGWLNGSGTNVRIDSVEAKNAAGNGFDLQGTNGLVQVELSNSVAHDNGEGVRAYALTASLLHNNVAYANGIGFNVGGDVQVVDNDAYRNTDTGIFVQGTGTTVKGGEVYGNGDDGVHAVFATQFNITGVDIHDNKGSGIYIASSVNGDVFSNTIHNNSLGSPVAELQVYGVAKVNTFSESHDIRVTGNIITGSEQSTYGIRENNAVFDNSYTHNVISHTQTGAIAALPSSEVSDNTDSIYTYGTRSNDKLNGDITQDVIFGGSGNDTLNGKGNNDTLIGGTGVDKLTGGEGNDIFRFDTVSESYRTATKSYADVITDFDVAHDKIDVAGGGIGFTGLGNGHNHTLVLAYNEAKDVTYLKNLDADVLGERFELTLNGNFLHTFTNANLQSVIQGTDGSDKLIGTNAAQTLLGGAGKDTLNGGAGDDRLDGGAGGDTLTGGAGADTFVYGNFRNSQRYDNDGTAQRDTITDFNGNENDVIDVSATGFLGLGNGHNGTLKVVLNAAGTQTALKSLDASDRDGAHFELLLQGNHVADLTPAHLIFKDFDGSKVVSSSPLLSAEASHTEATAITLTGVAEHGNEHLA
jgi:parallel beta-helix repeat protein